jgi:hypothetical protein
VRSHPVQQMRRPAPREFALLILHPCEEGMPEGWIFYRHPSSEAGERRPAQGFCSGRA